MIGQLAAIEVRIMNQHTSLPPLRRQRGVVMIVLGVMLVVLIGFAGLAIDLGRTYLVRTELQNAADAAALAGAKQLNQTATGMSSAVAYATAMAAQHTFNFGKKVISPTAVLDITFGKCPEEVSVCDWQSQTPTLDPVGRNFIKVDIRSRSLATFFAGVLGAATTKTFGLAVAGYSLVNLTPFGICAIDPNNPTATTTAGELLEYGFRRGVSYNVLDLSPLAPGVHYLINPVDKYVTGASGECSPDNSSPDAVAPFVCTGTSAAIPSAAPGGFVYGDSGYSAGKIQAALNSRFNVYGPPYACPVAEAPPDKNIRPYYPKYDGNKEYKPPKDWPSTTPVDWISLDPNRQTMNLAGISSARDYGVLWSYSRAVKADGTAFAATSTDWSKLYPAGAASAPAAPASYPEPSPYIKDSPWPSGNTAGVPDRRVLDLAIVKCPAGKGGVCTPIEVKAIGRFFMQVPAQIPARLDVEFAGTIKPPSVEIKLYR